MRGYQDNLGKDEEGADLIPWGVHELKRFFMASAQTR